MKPSQIARELRRVADRIEKSNHPSRSRVSSSIRGVLVHVAAGSMHERLGPITEKAAGSSQLLWHAFKALGIDDWCDTTSDGYHEVIAKMEELADSVGVTDIGYSLDYALKNFTEYNEFYKALEDIKTGPNPFID